MSRAFPGRDPQSQTLRRGSTQGPGVGRSLARPLFPQGLMDHCSVAPCAGRCGPQGTHSSAILPPPGPGALWSLPTVGSAPPEPGSLSLPLNGPPWAGVSSRTSVTGPGFGRPPTALRRGLSSPRVTLPLLGVVLLGCPHIHPSEQSAVHGAVPVGSEEGCEPSPLGQICLLLRGHSGAFGTSWVTPVSMFL